MNDDNRKLSERSMSNRSHYRERKQTNKQFMDQKSGNYSPSSNYNLSHNGQNRSQGNGYNYNSQHKYEKQNKKDISHSQIEKLIKQNDIIISLLKEIKHQLSKNANATLAENQSPYSPEEVLVDSSEE